MNINIDFFLEHCRKTATVLSNSKKADWTFNHIEYFDTNIKQKNDNTLYFIPSDLLKKSLSDNLFDNNFNLHLITSCNDNLAADLIENKIPHIFCYICEENELSIFNILINTAFNITEYQNKLYISSIMRCKNSEQLVEKISEYINGSIIILNKAFQVIETSANLHDKNNPLSIEKGSYFSIETEINFPIYNALEKSRNLDEAIVASFEQLNVNYICKTIINMNEIYGYIIGIVKEDSLIENSIGIIEIASIPILKMFNQNDLSSDNTSIFISELLYGKKMPELIISEWLRKIQWNIDDNIYLIVIRNPDGKSLAEKDLELINIEKNDRAILFKGDIIFIISQKNKLHGFDEFRLIPLNNKLIELNLFAGISRRCPNISDLSIYYRQAVCSVEKSIKKGNNNVHIMPYADTWLDDLLDEIHDKVDLKKYCVPQLVALDQFDTDNNTELLQTLICYYDNNQNTKDTAECMFLHRNTINYRLKKCKEILEMDLGNISRNIGLYISLKILDYIKNK